MKLYLVNCESIISVPLDTDYLLQTFFECGNRTIRNQVKEFIDRRGSDNFILDSGAFSLFNGIKKMTYAGLKKYIDSYCDFIIKYNITQFVEMDIDAIIGYEEVKKINKYIENRVGRKPMYVHHIETRTIEDLELACRESDYVMWGGIAKSRLPEDEVSAFINFAFDIGTRVHLLGYTPKNLDIMKNLYSCDSSSWTMGGRAGNIFQFTNDKIDGYKLDDMKRITYFELNNHNLQQWLKYQAYLKTKGWITE